MRRVRMLFAGGTFSLFVVGSLVLAATGPAPSLVRAYGSAPQQAVVVTGSHGTDRSGTEQVRMALPKGARTSTKAVAAGLSLTTVTLPRGPVRAWVLALDPSEALTIKDVLAGPRFPSFSTIEQMAEKYGAVAAVNGDLSFFGQPQHAFAHDGILEGSGLKPGNAFAISQDGRRAYLGRAKVRIVASGSPGIERIARWNADDPRVGEIAGYDAQGGSTQTPPDDACSVLLRQDAGPTLGYSGRRVLRSFVVKSESCEGLPPAVGSDVVLASRGTGPGAAWIQGLSVGEKVQIGWSMGWPNVVDVQGGSPLLVEDGRVVAPRSCSGNMCALNPRTGVGATAECFQGESGCRVFIVVVDGRQPGWSTGMTLVGFARLFKWLGASNALNLDGGGSSTMVVRGRVVNRPCEGMLRRVPSAMLVVPRRNGTGEVESSTNATPFASGTIR